MQLRNLFYAFMLCLVMMISAACSPALEPDKDGRYGTSGWGENRAYLKSPDPYDDDRGFKNDFQPADLNPNMVTGRNDLYNLDADAETMEQIASAVRGVDGARVNINGGNARVDIDIRDNNRSREIRDEVYDRLKLKFPRYTIHVDVD